VASRTMKHASLCASIVQGGGKRRTVRTTLPDGTVGRIEGFTTEGEAGRWIKDESTARLSARRDRIANQ